MKRETKLGSRAFVPVFMCQTIENIIWTTWGGRQNDPGTLSVASLMRCSVFYNIVIIKDNFLSHRSDPGADALIPSWCIDSIFFLSGSVSLRSVSLWKETRMKWTEASTEMTAKSCNPLEDSLEYQKSPSENVFFFFFSCQTLESSRHFWWYLTSLITRGTMKTELKGVVLDV